ncbi:hypothetical protein BDV93DRAFT_521019 [Ceratobasidium sp. AG-I]|nr:hypothetical protein BDV93DRAFT_521019 [Ceratobasidium sp. AG-I]
MVASINRLPPEILSRIFVTLVRASQYAVFVHDRRYDEINYPVQLSSICVHWRQVAISTPTLWSSIELLRSSDSFYDPQYLDMFYERSANAPLSVRLGKFGHEYNLDAVNEQLASLLRLYATRLYSLAIAYYFPGFSRKALSTLLAEKATGRVRKLALHTDWLDAPILADSSLQQHALSELFEPLHTLYLCSVCFDWNLVCCRNLVVLHLLRLGTVASPSAPQLASFLSANPTIRKLHIGDFESRSYESSLPPINLPELQNLEFNVSPAFTQWLFNLLHPGTRDITLQLHTYAHKPPGTKYIEVFSRFFQRSRIITLRILGDSWIPFSSVAAYLPHLETLGTHNPVRGYDLSHVNTQYRLLTKLHTVELEYCATRDVESGLITVLSLPSVKQIRIQSFRTGVTFMDVDQVREWMRGKGIIANVEIGPELLFFHSVIPFM